MPKLSPAGADPKVVAGTAAFSKFMTVLQRISDADAPPNVAALAAATGFPRPTVYRIVAALAAEGLIADGVDEGTYMLGPRLISLASRSWERSSLRVASAEVLAQLRDATRETVHLAVPSAQGMVYIDKLESPQTVRMASRIGTRVTLYSSSVGKAYLAALPADVCDSLIEQIEFARFTPNTITSRAKLRKEIRATAGRGYSLDDEENELQIFCCGAAILDADGAPVGCVSISMPLYRHSEAATQANASRLLDACRAISAKLGRQR
ncbi:IclR family transcriptional regulator [Paraburkholderia caballeronis]|uniref:IclR family transcriptional regulator n=1 Tax=Paraburkholderia caballeronis TaxID=416943 RepID=UPI001066DC21|nr:IclR family transcriptional regulator [Paraburkholderia caballeronis]TDV13972.1 IclR family transcriptional regulator [Paraburkholderia caballeronis]TDV15485.1 IclR family transcriptional regulator [Paraburkholderia caballeronis]TDV24953.1 IclR family transcriptional regulator [Paraburkholderia caballeronis]